MIRYFAPLACLALVSGCSTVGLGQSDFVCDTEIEKCPSTPQAYVDTHLDTLKQYSPRPSAIDLANRNSTFGDEQRPLLRSAQAPSLSAPAWPKPVLEPAQVMRIWVSPWVDQGGTLHWPSYLFTELKDRKWSFGGADFKAVKQLVPVQVPQRRSIDPTSRSPGALTGAGGSSLSPRAAPGQ